MASKAEVVSAAERMGGELIHDNGSEEWAMLHFRVDEETAPKLQEMKEGL